MAGSISAGAYTAGVLDYLFETLEKWQEAKDAVRRGERAAEDLPMHEVVLDVLNGASGGGMCAAISAIMLQEKGPYESGRHSRLFKAWVNLNDADGKPQTLEQMLDGDDLRKEGKILSLLDSTFIDQVAAKTFGIEKEAVRPPGFRPWVSDKLEVVVTVSNTRGIPYSIQFAGEGLLEKHTMTNFKHLLKFTTDEGLARLDPSFIKIDFSKAGDGEGKADASNIYYLQEAAKATGAFPLGLRPRTLVVPRRQIEEIHFPLTDIREVSTASPGNSSAPELVKSENFLCRYLTPSTVKPDWMGDQAEHYSFTCVDGGMTNNEPFEITRELLLRKDPERNNIPRSPQVADRCVIMIDPFPNQNDYCSEKEYREPEDIFSMFPILFKTMMNQPLFKVEDIELARHDDIYSRFLIVPSRSDRDGKSAIASATLGGFGGFFDRNFRIHDFELGRRNCQRFLRTHFGIPVSAIEENDVFSGKWTKSGIRRFGFRKMVAGKPVDFVPIIPDLDVLGWDEEARRPKAASEVAKLPFPKYDWKKNTPRLRRAIWQRVRHIARYTIRHRIHITLHRANFWRNLLRFFLAVAVLVLLLPFLLVAALPLYLMLRNYVLNRILRVIRTNFEELGVIDKKKQSRAVVPA